MALCALCSFPVILACVVFVVYFPDESTASPSDQYPVFGELTKECRGFLFGLTGIKHEDCTLKENGVLKTALTAAGCPDNAYYKLKGPVCKYNGMEFCMSDQWTDFLKLTHRCQSVLFGLTGIGYRDFVFMNSGDLKAEFKEAGCVEDAYNNLKVAVCRGKSITISKSDQYLEFAELTKKCQDVLFGLTGIKDEDCTFMINRVLKTTFTINGCPENVYNKLKVNVCKINEQYPEFAELTTKCQDVLFGLTGNKVTDCKVMEAEGLKTMFTAAECSEDAYDKLKDAVCNGMTLCMSTFLAIVCLSVHMLRMN